MAPADNDLLGGHLLRRGRALRRFDARWRRPEGTAPARPRAVLGAGACRRRQSARSVGGHQQPPRRAVVLDRQPGLGILGDRTVLAVPARRGTSLLVLAGASRGCARAAHSRDAALRHLLPHSGLRDSILLSARVLLRCEDALLDRRCLALLDHPSVGRRLL